MRDQAERLARQKIDAASRLSEYDRNKLLQELHIHQIELELQNEELRQSQARLAYAHQQYLDLYNEAPIGYASLDDSGLIVRANRRLADMLEVEKHTINGRALAEYMVLEDQSIFRGRFKAFANQPEGKLIDVQFRKGGAKGDSFIGRIQGKRITSDDGDEKSAFWTETLLIVISDITELKKTEAKIHFQAYHDDLTGLPNRITLLDRLDNALSLAKRQRSYGALLFMDLDRFKNVNDSLGHHTGDKLLIGFTKRLREHIRKEDLLVRMGGDEFVILMAEQHHNKQTSAVSAQRFAEHLNESLSEPIEVGSHLFQVTLSTGINVYPFEKSDNVNDVVRQADIAMYQAKSEGRGLVRFFHSNMQDAARQRMTLEAELRVALVDQQFELFYQPQVTAEGGVHALEVLVRWRHPYRGIVLPDKFVPVTEDTGMIVPLGEWIIETAFSQIAQWREQNAVDSNMHFAINVSAKQLESGSFSERVEEMLSRYSIDPASIVFEITESLLLPEGTLSATAIHRLSDIGIIFSIDDFGTGFSSLSVMQTAPIGQLKIDKRFVRDLCLAENSQNEPVQDKQYALVDAIISLGKALNLEVVAEGVETEVQGRVLQHLGCRYMQGYYYSKPLPAEGVSQLLREA